MSQNPLFLKGNVKPFSYAGIDIFNLNLQQLRNLFAHVLEHQFDFQFNWEKDHGGK